MAESKTLLTSQGIKTIIFSDDPLIASKQKAIAIAVDYWHTEIFKLGRFENIDVSNVKAFHDDVDELTTIEYNKHREAVQKERAETAELREWYAKRRGN